MATTRNGKSKVARAFTTTITTAVAVVFFLGEALFPFKMDGGTCFPACTSCTCLLLFTHSAYKSAKQADDYQPAHLSTVLLLVR